MRRLLSTFENFRILDKTEIISILSFISLTCSMFQHSFSPVFLLNMAANRFFLCLFFPCPSAVWLHPTSSPGKTFALNVPACLLLCLLAGAGCLVVLDFNGFLPRCSDLVHAGWVCCAFVAALLVLFWFQKSGHILKSLCLCSGASLHDCVCLKFVASVWK